jgi:hypothetical protein
MKHVENCRSITKRAITSTKREPFSYSSSLASAKQEIPKMSTYSRLPVQPPISKDRFEGKRELYNITGAHELKHQKDTQKGGKRCEKTRANIIIYFNNSKSCRTKRAHHTSHPRQSEDLSALISMRLRFHNQGR